MLDLLVLTLFPALLAIAAVGDLLTYKIPNWLSISLVALFAATALVSGLGWATMGLHVGLSILLLLVGMVLFAFKFLGGGDAKLLAAAGLWMGWAGMPAYLLWVSIAGGCLALVIVLFRKLPLSEETILPAWLTRLRNPSEGIPYGIALAIGALMAFPQTIWFAAIVAPS